MGEKQFKFEDFHPLLLNRSSESEVLKSIEDIRKTLPATLTESEIEARWQQYLRETERNE